MILVDTSVWVDHLRRGDANLARLLDASLVLMHPFVLGEIACGSLPDRTLVLELLHNLPEAEVADTDEVLRLIERNALHGKGLGYVDIHLLAAVKLTPEAALWTRDKRLLAAAQAQGLAYDGAHVH